MLVNSTPIVDQFHQHLQAAFVCKDPKNVKRRLLRMIVFFILGSPCQKDSLKYVSEFNPSSQFHQHFKLSFCADIFCHKNYKSKL